MMKTFALFLLLALFFSSSLAFDPFKLHFIDHYKRPSGHYNYIVRGNLPLGLFHETFAWHLVKDTLISVAEEHKIPFDHHFQMVDVCLLQPEKPSNLQYIEIEKEYFEYERPDHGRFVLWPTRGSSHPPSDYTPEQIEVMVKNFTAVSKDDIPWRMAQFDAMLHEDTTNGSQVIYFHCEAGRDRTGETAGAYYMKVLGQTFTHAMATNMHIAGDRHISTHNGYAMQWYCYYLQHVEGRQGLRCDEKYPVSLPAGLGPQEE
eukprot:gnl/Trimastix_PCT/2825.p1 GENE.gnl/Trimastix_PCT/2825~~gnl/Trimastix_PCT/2825.p1  ORF type:complete len:260 (+),score=73.39 gnl/Trimastix_PCT/2825:536-1315(+)